MISFSLASQLNESRFHLAVEIIDELGHIHIEKETEHFHCLQNHHSQNDRHVS
jgi:hypothetical protein